jgi:diguanylate cyclase (GGDEF)-like protein
MLTGGLICFLMSVLLFWQSNDNQEHKRVLVTLALCLMGGAIALFLAVSDSLHTHPISKYTANVVGTVTYYFAMLCMLQLYRNDSDRTIPTGLGVISALGYLAFTGDNAFYAWNQFMRMAMMGYTFFMIYGARDPAASGLRYFSLVLPLLSVVCMAPQFFSLMADLHGAPMPLVQSTSDASRSQAILWALSPSIVYISVMSVIQSRIAYRLRESAYVDVLTGAHSRRYLIERGTSMMVQSDSYSHQNGTSLLLIDVDHFKRVNDTWGHLVGDAVLRHCVSCIREVVRSDDSVVSRYGGEEFCVLLPNTSLAAAASIAERTRAHIASRPYFHGDLSIVVTVSIGVARQESTTCTLATVLSKADELMYLAKQAGRNRIVATSPTAS